MPYRRAHWALLALFPLILVAFWPHYFGQLRAAPFALHAHGVTATLWLALVTWQSWSARAGRLPAHRTAGLALFLLVPLFAAGGMLAMRDMIALGLAATDPFHAAYSLPLAFADGVAVLTFLALVGWALARRRRVALHGGAMLATAWLVLPPILARLLPIVPGFRGGFVVSFYTANAVAIAGALAVAARERRGAGPFLFAALSLIIQAAAFETVALGAAWTGVAAALLAVPPSLLVTLALLIGAAVPWLAWRTVPPRAPRTAAA